MVFVQACESLQGCLQERSTEEVLQLCEQPERRGGERITTLYLICFDGPFYKSF